MEDEGEKSAHIYVCYVCGNALHRVKFGGGATLDANGCLVASGTVGEGPNLLLFSRQMKGFIKLVNDVKGISLEQKNIKTNIQQLKRPQLSNEGRKIALSG